MDSEGRFYEMLCKQVDFCPGASFTQEDERCEGKYSLPVALGLEWPTQFGFPTCHCEKEMKWQ